MGDKTYNLLVADTPIKREKGLMHIKKLPKNIDGMIFFFPTKKIQTFWNKNTYIDLDIFWFSDKKYIGKSFLPSIKKTGILTMVSSSKEINIVVERKTYY
jgi:uncharacterized membrane protein (UPF0127 family)